MDQGTSVELLGGELQSTNNRMELEAPLRALRHLRAQGHAGPVLVRSDSQYVIKGLTEWRKGWERRGWRSSSGEAVKNAEIWRALFAETDAWGPRARFEWVRGHNGDPGNERADALALEGLQRARAERAPGLVGWVRDATGVRPLA